MISFVYFDIGGVLISDLTANNQWGQMKKDMGVTPKDDQDFENFFDFFEKLVNEGELKMDDIVPLISLEYHLDKPSRYGYSLEDDMIQRFAANPSMIPILKMVHKHTRIGLLTNMYPGFLQKIKNRGLLPSETFDIVIDSSIEKVAKPDPKIFEIAQERSGVFGNEILFVENTKRHVEAAKKLGWQTFWYDSKNPEMASTELEKYFDLHFK